MRSERPRPDWWGWQADRVSRAEIKAASTGGRGNGWTRATLARWGVPWPPPRGWKDVLAGKYD